MALATVMSAQSRESVIHEFHDAGAKSPSSGLISDASGNLFGVTRGAVYELSPNPGGGFKYQVLAVMPGGIADFARGNLVRDSVGNLFGITEAGTDNCGYIFEVSPHSGSAWSFNIIKEFDCVHDGRAGGFTMAMDSFGNLYGLTSGSFTIQFDGSLFELSPRSGGTWKYTVLHNFAPNEGHPETGVVMDAHGNLYGCNEFGVFRAKKNSSGVWSVQQIHHFEINLDGDNPMGDLLLDAAGNIYGTNSGWGPNFSGTAYKLSPGAGSWTLTVLHAFGDTDDGLNPEGGLIQDAAGNLYGTTANGDQEHRPGTVFKLSLVGGEWQKTTLYTFGGIDASDGANPQAPLLLKENTLYGTTVGGGDSACTFSAGCGTVFRIR